MPSGAPSSSGIRSLGTGRGCGSFVLLSCPPQNERPMSDYSDRQRRRDAQYAEAWNALTPEEREELARLGISGPELPRYNTCKPDDDRSIELASGSPDAAPVVALQAEVSPDSLESIRNFVGVLISTQQTRLSLECAAILLGLPYVGGSMSEVAKRHKLTRAAISKRCIELSQQLGIEHAPALRSLTARRHYATAQSRRTH